MPGLQDLIDNVTTAIADPQSAEVDEAVAALIAGLQDQPEHYAEVDMSLLRALRSGRHFGALRLLADRLNGLGHPDPTVRLMLAQGLIDTGAPSTAIDVLLRIKDKAIEKGKQIEISGLKGRAFKEIFQSMNSADDARAGTLMGLAVAEYAKGFEASEQSDFWTGENLMALLRRATILGIPVDSTHSPAALADHIKTVIEDKPDDDRTYWHWATLAVTHIYRRSWDDAGAALARGLECKDVDAFALAGTIRQLREWWDIDDSGPEAAGLIAALQARLLKLTGGQLEMTSEQIQSMNGVPEDSFEKILGAQGPKTHGWILQFVNSGASVGQITSTRDGGVGTCFIVRGGEFLPELGDEKLILTNDHVVSPHPEKYSANPPLRITQAKAKFEIFGQEQGLCEIAAKEIVWSSGAQDHDACLIRLQDPIPDELPPLEIVRYVPIVDPDSGEGVYIIGHPGGRTLSYSMQNNELLDHDCKAQPEDVAPRRIHYFTPTEPGSSGSPALNADLDVIGLHHAGGRYMRRLNGVEGTYAANEAIWIDSICRAAGKDLAAGRTRYDD